MSLATWWVLTCCSLVSFLTFPSDAVLCPCYNGKQASAFSCDCSCNRGYLAPTCTFTLSDTSVRVIFYLNMSASDFVAELFVDAVSFASTSNATFVAAKNVSRFNATSCTTALPGGAVERLMASVAYKDPWSQQFSVVSAHVVTPAIGVASSSSSGLQFDTTLYNGESFIITVNSILWFALGAVAVLLIVGSELLFSTNEEQYLAQNSLKHRRSSRRLKRISSKSSFRDDATGEDIVVTTEQQVSINLNEHRRAAPPPTMSLPMQILDDFVDSDSDEGGAGSQPSGKHSSKPSSSRSGGVAGGISTSKYSLGKRVEGSRQASPHASRQASPHGSPKASPHGSPKHRGAAHPHKYAA